MADYNYDKKLDTLIINGVLVPRKDIASDEVTAVRNEDAVSMVNGQSGGTQTIDSADISGEVNFSIFDGSNTFAGLLLLKEAQLPFVLSFKRGNIAIPIVASGCRVAMLERTGGEEASVNVKIICSKILGT